MEHNNEQELYQTVCDAFDRLRWVPYYADLVKNDLSEFGEKQLNHQKLCLLLEGHYSKSPVVYTHNDLVPRIEENPQNWLILNENAGTIITDPMRNPTHFYFQELAKLFNIPQEDAIAQLYDPEVRRYIVEDLQASYEITLADFDSFLVFSDLQNLQKIQGQITMEDLTRFVNNMSKHYQCDPQYIAQIIGDFKHRPGPAVMIPDELYVNPWNKFSQRRFNEICSQYKDKTNILVSVGIDHSPVFRPMVNNIISLADYRKKKDDSKISIN